MNQSKSSIQEQSVPKSCKYIIMPTDKFKLYWNIIIILMLSYTATYMPYQICFLESSGGFMKVLEYIMDVLFGIDIFINFISAYETADGTIEPRLSLIAYNYCKFWFFIDTFAVIPVQVFDLGQGSDTADTVTTSDSSQLLNYTIKVNGTNFEADTSQSATISSYNKLLRIARVARLYRLLRIVRLFKIFKIFRYSQMAQRMMDKIKMNESIARLVMILIMAFFSVHLVSCFWYVFAKFRDFDPDTWVYRLKKQDASSSDLYLECIYWAMQTVATVGFGEFGAFTIPELLMSIVWMIYGVGFYSAVIGYLTSMIANEAANSENQYNKLKALEEFAKKTNMPDDLHYKIQQFLENNFEELFSRIDEKILISELPITLRDEVLQH